jgi:hypothetical protein
MKLKIIDTAHHRNGVCGAPFDIVLFQDKGPEGSRKVGILFDEPHHCAILDVAKLAAGDIAFASNSWRGDHYESSLRQLTEDSPPSEPPELDIDNLIRELLQRQRQVAVIWGIEDVKGVRPDLSEEKCWEVLQTCVDQHDCQYGFTWTFIEDVAQDLFGDAPETDEGEGA